MKAPFLLLALLIGHFCATACFDDGYISWEGDVSANWNTAGNWEGNAVPSGTAEVLIDPEYYDNAPLISSNSSFTPAGITLTNGARLTINANLSNSKQVQVSGGSKVTVNGGTWTVPDNFRLEIIGNNSEVIVSGGTVNVQEDVLINGNRDGMGADPALVINSGSVSIGDDLIFSRHMDDQPELNLNGGSLTVSGDVVNNGTNININMAGGSFSVDGDLSLSAATDDFSMSGGSLGINGDWDVQGLLSIMGGTIAFTGSVEQSIFNTNGGSFFNLHINNTSSTGVVLEDPISVENTLTLTDGILYSDAVDELTIEDGATVSGAGNASYVDGWCRKRGNDAFVFPVGGGSYYRPIGISAPGSVSDEFTARYYYNDPGTSYSTTSLQNGLNHVSTEEYWDLSRDAGTSTVNVSLSWSSNSGGIATLGDMRVAHWNGTQWEDLGNGATTGDETEGTVMTSQPVNSFSPFSLGSASSINVLPVKWLSFNAVAGDGDVELQWATASEQFNDYFEVQRSSDGISFTEIGSVYSKATNAGNSSKELHYDFTDGQPLDGTSYYRLKQTDINGDFEYSETIPVQLDYTPVATAGEWNVRCFRKAGTNELALIVPEEKARLHVAFYSLSGALVGSTSLNAFNHEAIVNVPGGVSPGLYLLQVGMVGEEGKSAAVKVIVL